MPNKVFFFRFTSTDPDKKVSAGLRKLFEIADLYACLKAGDITAVKVHFGEKGNTSFLPAKYVAPIVECIKKTGAKAFVTDTNVLYKSARDNAVDHLQLAFGHGFRLQTLGAPVIIADGISGHNEVAIRIDAPLNSSVNLAAEIVKADSVIVVSHATGHMGTGLAATIKNMGMGMSSRRGKLAQHSVSKPVINAKKCTRCGACLNWCPADAIRMEDTSAVIDEPTCIGCGECLTVCRFGAVRFQWNSSNLRLQHQIAEHALGIVRQKQEKIGFMTFMINMTKNCDCMAQKPEYLIEDIGVVAGRDPVAIDQAVYDLTRDSRGDNLPALAYPDIDAAEQLIYGEKIGLGSRKYILEEIKA